MDIVSRCARPTSCPSVNKNFVHPDFYLRRWLSYHTAIYTRTGFTLTHHPTRNAEASPQTTPTSTSQFTACFILGLPEKTSPVPGSSPRNTRARAHLSAHFACPVRDISPAPKEDAALALQAIPRCACHAPDSPCVVALACALIKAGLSTPRLVPDAAPPPYRARQHPTVLSQAISPISLLVVHVPSLIPHPSSDQHHQTPARRIVACVRACNGHGRRAQGDRQGLPRVRRRRRAAG